MRYVYICNPSPRSMWVVMYFTPVHTAALHSTGGGAEAAGRALESWVRGTGTGHWRWRVRRRSYRALQHTNEEVPEVMSDQEPPSLLCGADRPSGGRSGLCQPRAAPTSCFALLPLLYSAPFLTLPASLPLTTLSKYIVCALESLGSTGAGNI